MVLSQDQTALARQFDLGHQGKSMLDRKSTRLNSSHGYISYAVFCLKKKKQFSGRVQQTYKHSEQRFFVPEHGTMFTLALVRVLPTATKEIQYLNAKGALTYTDIACDPVLDGNLPPREISMKDVFRSGDSSKKFKIAECQWYRYAPFFFFLIFRLPPSSPFFPYPPPFQ